MMVRCALVFILKFLVLEHCCTVHTTTSVGGQGVGTLWRSEARRSNPHPVDARDAAREMLLRFFFQLCTNVSIG